MKVLFVSSGNSGELSPFVKEQAEALQLYGVTISHYFIIGNGCSGYLKNIFSLRKHIKKNSYDLIHAHYGLSGLVATSQNQLPVLTTFHGSDIYKKNVRLFSKLAWTRSDHSIFVNEEMQSICGFPENSTVIQCGVNVNVFKEKKSQLNDRIMILFSSSFNRSVKNYSLAKEALDIVQSRLNKKIELIELKGYSREGVANLLSSVNLALLTSRSEGSPQFIKEAMACNCPAVSTDVGDVKWLFGNEPGYFLASNNAVSVSEKIIQAIEYSVNFEKTNGRQRILELGLDSFSVAKKIKDLYKGLL